MIPMRPGDIFDKLNAEQKQALDWTRSLSIRANAGSGKTRVLIERIVQILHHSFHSRHPLTLHQIVAITFTRKAAAELRARLRKALVICFEQSKDDERAFWQERLDELPDCPIGTIDSLCHRLLGAAVSEGMFDDLDPAFGILQGLDRDELLERAIERTEQLIDGDAKVAWDNWLLTQGRYELENALWLLLGSPVSPEDCERALDACASRSAEEIVELMNAPALAAALRHARENHTGARRQVQTAITELKKVQASGDKTKTVAEKIEELSDYLKEGDRSPAQVLVELRNVLCTKSGTAWKSGLVTKGVHKSPAMHELTEAWLPHLAAWDLNDPGQDGFALSRQLVLIYKHAKKHFDDLCREENLYDFNALAEKTLKALQDQKFAKRLTGLFHYVLVDEFQDTNDLHWRIVAGVAGEDPESPVKSNKLMIVGDPQQSIYRFRQADPTVFGRIIQLIRRGNESQKRANQPTAFDEHATASGVTERSSDAQRLGEMSLTKNYRSLAPLPIKLIDRLSKYAFDDVGFKYQALDDGNVETDPRAEVIYLVPNESNSGDAPGDGDEENNAAAALDTNQLQLTASELVRLHNEKKFPWKEMAILMRGRNKHLANLETTLREYGIPYQLVGGLGFWQRQEVRDLVSLVNCLANPSDELALFAVLRGPLIGLDDSELLFLSSLGGRNLAKGLYRVASLLDLEDQSELWKDNAELGLALQTAFGQITPERRIVLGQAVARLGTHGLWRQRVDRLPHAELLRLALDDSGAWAVYAAEADGDRWLANIRLLLDEVQALEAARPASLAAMARRLKWLVEESEKDEQAELDAPAGDAVQVMTVHAAKGLEFPVVAVVGLESQFKYDGPPIWLLDRFQHLNETSRDTELGRRLHGLPILRFRDPEMPLIKIDPLLHQAVAKIDRDLMKQEEARIFHVAITRAERVLLLAGAADFKSNCWQRWVQDAFGLEDGFEAGQRVIPESDGLNVRMVRTAAPASAISSTVVAAPSLDLRVLTESPRRRSIAATQLGEMVELKKKDPAAWEMRYRHGVRPHVGTLPRALLGESDPKAKPELGKWIGTLVHRALELGDSLPSKPADRRRWLLAQAASLANVRADADDPGTADDSPAVILAEIVSATEKILKEVLPNNPFLGLLQAEGDSEVDFALPIGSWMITGRFDRLIRGSNGSWEIVDWKTDDASPERIVEKYIDQMRLYALALLRSLSEPQRATTIIVHLAMTHARSSKLLEFQAAELMSLADQLNQRLNAFTNQFGQARLT